MQDKNTTHSTFSQLFQTILSKKIWTRIKSLNPNLDSYVKKLFAPKLIQLIMLAHLEQKKSLQEISFSLSNEHLSQSLQLESISASQLSRRLQDLPTNIADQLLGEHVRQVGINTSMEAVRQTIGRLNLIDSSTVSLAFTLYPWAKFRKTKSGIKLHLGLNFYKEPIPVNGLITEAKKNDKTQMDKLVVYDKDVINVFDRGYVDYEKFDEYCEAGIRFVTRLKENAYTQEIKAAYISEDSPIEEDLIVILGKNQTKMKHELRLVVTKDTQGNPVMILTNVFDKSAEEIGSIYRNRWKIELFFKWIKQHLQIKHLYGQSPAAVVNQIMIALITYCALMLMKLKSGYQGTLLQVTRILRECLYEEFSVFVRKIHCKYGKSTKGRRRLKHEILFEATEKQVEAGEFYLLNDLTYDPVIL
ncbi:MAG: IS4 family transposase [Peptococcaceae bacterium]|nr:IS4 family transposase [Peptococcaceae bacterium]